MATPRFKCCIVGAPGVGNSVLASPSLLGEFEKKALPPALSTTLFPVPLSTSSGPIILDLWDYTGDNETPPPNFYAGAKCAVIMFDVTARATYKAVPQCYKDVLLHADQVPVALVGNKVDVIERKVKTKQVTFHRKKNLLYVGMSVKANYNVEKLFLQLARMVTGVPDLQVLEAMALRPPEVAVDAVAIQRIEEELALHESMVPPDDDDL